ncbi:RPA family protein [Halolamina sp. C58]|uniref:RPA family protein n=1 Tax=Halolamina sp. C58 TaxID=3421640 RepID=UPI003EB713F1
MSADSGPGNREIARRLFAAEFDDATLSYSESDEERAPNYVVTPTGARVNRLFAVGVLTEVEQVNEDSLRGRVVDPTGAFVTYAGQYQPDEHAFLSRAEPPTFVALSGKARTFEPEDSDRVFTSVRPESINEVDAETRDRWVVSAAERTLHRIAVFTAALDSELRGDDLREALVSEAIDPSLAAGIPKAIEHYDTGTAYLEAVRSLAVEAVEQVAGERDAVGSLETLPDADTPTELGPLPDVSLDLDGVANHVSGSPESDDEETVESDADTSESGEPEPETTETPEAETAEPTDSGTESPAETAEPSAEEGESEEESTEEEELGDFDAGESVQETVEDEAEEIDDFDPEETVADDEEALTEEERQEVKEEFGAEFSTGSEVGEPGEAGIDVPSSEEELEEIEAEVTGEESDEAEPEEESDEDAAAVDLEDAVIDAMSELDDGDGADREAVVAHVVDEHGVDTGAVEDAVQDAMMSGKCYEPTDGTLKAI